MKTIILTFAFAMSASGFTNAAEPTPSTPIKRSHPGITYHDCSPVQAQLDQMARQLDEKRQECDGIYQELKNLNTKKMEAQARAQLPDSTVEDGYAFFNASQTLSAQAKVYNACDDQWWEIFRARANLLSKCK